MLLNLGEDIHERNPHHETAMTLAALEGHLAIVKVNIHPDLLCCKLI